MEPVTLIIAGIAIVLTASLAYAVNKYQEIQKKIPRLNPCVALWGNMKELISLKEPIKK